MALELKYQIVLVRPDGTRDVFRKTIQDRFGAIGSQRTQSTSCGKWTREGFAVPRS